MEVKNDKVKFVKFTSLKLSKDTANDDWANLNWAVRMGYPRIIVYTTNKGRKKGSKLDPSTIITAPFSYEAVFTIIGCFEDLMANKIANRYSVECWNKFGDGNKFLQSKVTVGLDESGVYFIGVTAPEKPKIKFEILPGKVWHKYCNGDGTEITDKGKLSTLYVKGYISSLKALMESELIEDAKEKLMLDRKTPLHAEPVNNAPKKDEPVTEIKVTEGDSVEDLF